MFQAVIKHIILGAYKLIRMIMQAMKDGEKINVRGLACTGAKNMQSGEEYN